MTRGSDRYCRCCGAHLQAAEAAGWPCAACRRRLDMIAEDVPPAVPVGFWDYDDVRLALASRHMGAVIRAYRRHPHHGPRPLPQETVARWAGLTQAQLSRIENGPGIVHLDRLTQWATLLGIPRDRLWFHVPDDPAGEEGDDVRRSEFLRLTGVAATAAATGSLGSLFAADDAAEALAWELWQQRRGALHPSELHPELAAAVSGDVALGSAWIVMDDQSCYAMAHPALVDVFVARRIFGGITRCDASLFASAQTSHDTDQVLRRYVAQDDEHVRVLTTWMTRNPDPVLRVNAAGVLGKLGRIDTTTGVIGALRADADTRHRYVTAVAARVLGLDWESAELLARNVDSAAAARWTPGQVATFSAQLAQETLNPRDGVARWCSLVLLCQLGGPPGDHGRDVTETLQQALRLEPVAENLRAIGSVLAGTSPLAV
jgi:transcriptional regulator with XRE-family HTH domain